MPPKREVKHESEQEDDAPLVSTCILLSSDASKLVELPSEDLTAGVFLLFSWQRRPLFTVMTRMLLWERPQVHLRRLPTQKKALPRRMTSHWLALPRQSMTARLTV